MPRLFSIGERNRKSPQQTGESLFDFHDTSGWTASAQFRALIDDWIGILPSDDQNEIVRRMRSGDSQFQQTLFELIAGAVFRGLGFKLQPHPILEGTKKRPDFRASRLDESFFIEVTTNNPSARALGAGKREAALLRAIDEITAPPGTFLRYRLIQAGRSNLPIRDAVSTIRAWIIEANSGGSRRSLAELDFDDWLIELELINTGSQRQFKRTIGIQSTSGAFLSPASEIRECLESKSKRYGPLSHPFIWLSEILKARSGGAIELCKS